MHRTKNKPVPQLSENRHNVRIGKKFRQRCCMSPILFNLYGESLMKEALAEVGDFKIIIIKYAAY